MRLMFWEDIGRRAQAGDRDTRPTPAPSSPGLFRPTLQAPSPLLTAPSASSAPPAPTARCREWKPAQLALLAHTARRAAATAPSAPSARLAPSPRPTRRAAWSALPAPTARRVTAPAACGELVGWVAHWVCWERATVHAASSARWLGRTRVPAAQRLLLSAPAAPPPTCAMQRPRHLCRGHRLPGVQPVRARVHRPGCRSGQLHCLRPRHHHRQRQWPGRHGLHGLLQGHLQGGQCHRQQVPEVRAALGRRLLGGWPVQPPGLAMWPGAASAQPHTATAAVLF